MAVYCAIIGHVYKIDGSQETVCLACKNGFSPDDFLAVPYSTCTPISDCIASDMLNGCDDFSTTAIEVLNDDFSVSYGVPSDG